MGNYSSADFTWGFEIEMGDIPKLQVEIPAHLGKWEYAERDIVNANPPYRGICADPLGINPPVGGEINTMPTKTWKEQVERIQEILWLIRSKGHNPTEPPTGHNHHHVHVNGLREDMEGLKKLAKYVLVNQKDFVSAAYRYEEVPGLAYLKKARNYLKYDGGKLTPEYILNNILTMAKTFEDFIRLHAAGKDGVTMGRPFRYAINMYSLKHVNTIEFRCFRCSFNPLHIAHSALFIELFLLNALNEGDSVKTILESHDFEFPPMKFDPELLSGWEQTKLPENKLARKNREYYEV